MKLSILIAHFNSATYFKDCYQSLLSQTYQDFEIIILDDESIDNSLDEVKKLTNGDSRVKIYHNDQNMGVGFTKNKLPQLATTDLCAFLDPDDALTDNAVEEVMKTYKEHPNILATYSQLYICDENLTPQKIHSTTRKVKPHDKLFFNINFEIAHFFTFKKSAYNRAGGLDTSLTTAEDQDFYLKIYDLGEISYIEKPLYYYRVHNKSLSNDPEKSEISHRNWNIMLKNTVARRGLKTIYGMEVDKIENLSEFLFSKENTFFKKLKRKLPF